MCVFQLSVDWITAQLTDEARWVGGKWQTHTCTHMHKATPPSFQSHTHKDTHAQEKVQLGCDTLTSSAVFEVRK